MNDELSQYIAWLRQQAVVWRRRGLAAYKRRDDREAMRLLDMADDSWRVIRELEADNKRQQRQASA